MLEVGDTVKVISMTSDGAGGYAEFLPIGTIGKITEVFNEDEIYYGVKADGHYSYYYLENELEKGRLEWVKD